MRSLLLFLANQRFLYRLAMRYGLLRSLALRFVAGEQLEDGVVVAQALAAQRILATLDYLGESVTNEAEARAAADSYLEALAALHQAGVEPNVSLKLTQMGLDISDSFCFDNLLRVVECATRLNGFVRIDMESSAYTDRTLALFWRLWERSHHVGVVLQAYLYRTSDDVDAMIGAGVRVRLCKGAYLESSDVAFQSRAEIDANYRRLMERLLLKGNYPALATHDARLLRHAVRFAQQQRIPPSRFEFQMLYGVRRDLQTRLAKLGYNVRVYVPYGEAWYPYLMRRLAERPANLMFVLYSLLAEGLLRR